jgi:hypothetical protein
MRRVVKHGFDALDHTYRAHHRCPDAPHDEHAMRAINQFHGHSARHGTPSPAGLWDASGPGRAAELITRTPGSYPPTLSKFAERSAANRTVRAAAPPPKQSKSRTHVPQKLSAEAHRLNFSIYQSGLDFKCPIQAIH